MAAAGGWELVTEVDDDNPVVGDLRITGTRIAKIGTFGDAVAQAVSVALSWWRGEWFLDTSRGVPYLDEVFATGVSEASVAAVLRREVLKVDGVKRVIDCEVTVDRSRRFGSAEIVIETTEGEERTLVIPGNGVGGAG